MAAHPYAPVTIDPLGSENDDTADQNQLAYYSSVVPALGSNAIKPDLVAVGADPSLLNYVYSAAQTYDPLGQVYSSTGYSAFAGTSASAPMVAGAAALVKQKHPNFTPAQIKSALINTTAPSISTDDGALGTLLPVDIQSIGAGLLDVGAAVNATVTVAPASLSFGALASVPQTLQFQLTNTGSSAVNLTVSNLPNNTKSTSVTVAFTPATLTLAPGASGTVGVTLSGTMPQAGSEYSAFVGVTGSGISLRIPYMYLVRDGIAANLYQVTGGFDGQVGTVFPGQIVVQLTDDAGLPVANAPVAFTATGGGKIQNASTVTNAYGIAQADAVLGVTPGFSTYTATAGGMTIPFSSNYARPKPVIPANGVVNAGTSNGNFVPTVPIAPGSYVAIGHTTDVTVAQRNPGSGLSDLIGFEAFGRLPLAIDPCAAGYPALREGPGCVVTVSFDVPSAGISVPGRLYYVSPTQINVLAPWELQGQSSVQVKVSINQTTSNVVTVPVADASPAFFEYNSGAIAQTLPDGTLVTSSNPAKRNGDIVLYANGLGPVNNQPASGDAASLTASANTKSNCVVTIATVQITPTFCGLTPTLISLYQVNIHVPANVPAGNQPITISVGGKTSPASSIIIQ